MRIDRFLSVTGCCSRSDAKKAIRGKKVAVNGRIVRTADEQLDPQNDTVSFCGTEVLYTEHVYIMLNKPEGVVSATDDNRDKTVIDLLGDRIKTDKLFPCGRLDKNTLGLVLITDDGDLAHDLLSPKHHVDKKYRFSAQKPISAEDAQRFENRLVLDDGYVTLPANIELDPSADSGVITLREGKYHQIKRMMMAIDNKITYLERISFGPLLLDTTLSRGEWRFLTPSEEQALKNAVKSKTNDLT